MFSIDKEWAGRSCLNCCIVFFFIFFFILCNCWYRRVFQIGTYYSCAVKPHYNNKPWIKKESYESLLWVLVHRPQRCLLYTSIKKGYKPFPAKLMLLLYQPDIEYIVKLEMLKQCPDLASIISSLFCSSVWDKIRNKT